jgi:hypothetical protein
MKAPGNLHRWRWPLFVVVALATAWAGLDPKGYRFGNEVTLTPDGTGLGFARFGRIHTDPVVTVPRSEVTGRPGFSISIAFEPREVPDGEFPVVASLHSGSDDTQLILGLWRDHLIAMLGTDFAHRRLLPRVSADLSAMPVRPILASVVASEAGAVLYVNGKPVDSNTQMRLALPVEPEAARLVLGNSADASRPFSGTIQLFELQATSYGPEEVMDRYEAWRNGEGWPVARGRAPLLLFQLGDSTNGLVPNRGSLGAPLRIPESLPPLGRRALAGPVTFDPADGEMRRDVLVNFFGFLPLGIALAWVLGFAGRRAAVTVLLATAAAFAASFFIELAQAWMPTRDSSLRDLLLNTAGAAMGARLALLRTSTSSRRP